MTTGIKTDHEQLTGILEQFDPNLVEQVFNEFSGECPLTQKCSDMDDRGEEVTIGEDARVSLEELDLMERIISPQNNLLPAHFLEEGNMVQRAVARVRIPGIGFGSGFLVSSSLLMTNNHVLPNTATANKAEAQFNYQNDLDGNPKPVDTYQFDPKAFFYTNAALDITLVRVKQKSIFWPLLNFPQQLNGLASAAVPKLDLSSIGNNGTISINETLVPGVSTIPSFTKFFYTAGSRWGSINLSSNISFAIDQHLNIIQHPRARRKEVALQQNQLERVYTNFVRYTTDTDMGSSGSPVFNNAWELVALHHAAGDYVDGTWINNEGVRIDKIITSLRNNLSGTASNRLVLNELGI